MVPTKVLREQAMKLLAADATTLAPAADPNHMVLIQNNFTPTEDTVVGDLEPADFDGATPKEVVVGTQPEALDPATKDAIIDILAPAGGFRWETTGTTNLPQTIYGVALMNEAETVLLASEKFDNPVVLNSVNERVEFDNAHLRQLMGSIS